jgi:hypothetical protein
MNMATTIALMMSQQAPLKRRLISTTLHGATTQKTAIFTKRISLQK